MTATDRRYFVLYPCGTALSGYLTLAVACEHASHGGGAVYERTDSGTVRLVAQMARRKGQKKRVEKGKRS